MATNGLELAAATLRAQYADDQIPLSSGAKASSSD